MAHSQAVGREIVAFPRDCTVSRCHFEISKESSDVYLLRDLGSARGTYIRVQFGKKKALHPGMIFLIGKHQVSAFISGVSVIEIVK